MSYRYDDIARAMNDSIVLPGPDLCDWVQNEYSMMPTLAAKTVKSCPSATPTADLALAQESGEARQLLTAFDRGVLVS